MNTAHSVHRVNRKSKFSRHRRCHPRDLRSGASLCAARFGSYAIPPTRMIQSVNQTRGSRQPDAGSRQVLQTSVAWIIPTRHAYYVPMCDGRANANLQSSRGRRKGGVASPLVLMVGGVANPEDPIERASTVESPLSVGEGSMLGEERPCRPIVQHLPPPASGMWKPGGKVFRHVEDDHPL